MRLVYWRHHTRYEEKSDDLDELVCSAAAGADHGWLAYECILNDDGTVALDKKALREAVHAKWDEWDKADQAG